MADSFLIFVMILDGFDNEIQPIGAAGDTSISAIEEVSVEFQDLSVRYDFNPTSLGNAERFIQRHSKRVQYVVEMAIWIIWMGFWVVDQGEVRVRQWAKDTIKSRYEELNGLDQRHRAFLFNWLQKSESDDKIVEMLKLASTDPNIAVSVSQLDAHPDLLALRQRRHQPSHRGTRGKPAGVVLDQADPDSLRSRRPFGHLGPISR